MTLHIVVLKLLLLLAVFSSNSSDARIPSARPIYVVSKNADPSTVSLLLQFFSLLMLSNGQQTSFQLLKLSTSHNQLGDTLNYTIHLLLW